MENIYQWGRLALVVLLALACDPGSGARLSAAKPGAAASFALRFLVPPELEAATVKATLVGRPETVEKIAARAYGFSVLPPGTYDLSVEATVANAAPSAARVAAVVIPEGGGVDLGQLTFAIASGTIKGVAQKKTDPSHAGIAVEVIQAGKSTTTDDKGNYEITGLSAGTYTVKFSSGSHQFIASAVLGIGETKVLETVVLGDVVVDGTGTGAAFKVVLNDGAAFATSRTVKLKLVAPAAVLKARIGENPTPTGEYLPVSTATFTFSGDGTRTLYALFEAQTTVVSASIIIDTAPPSAVSVGLSDGSTITKIQKHTLKVAAVDATEMRIALSEQLLAAAPWTTFATSVANFDLGPTHGARQIWYQVRDAAGNATPPAFTPVVLSLDGPEIASLAIVGTQPLTSGTATIRITPSAANATPPTKVGFSCNNTSFSTANYTADAVFDLTSIANGCVASQGSRTVYVRLQDAVGSVGTSKSVTFTVDSVGPSAPTNLAVQRSPGPNDTLGGATLYTNQSTTMTVIGKTEANAKVMITGATANKEADANGSGDFSAEIIINANATTTLSFLPIDAVGNAGTAATAQIVHDSIPPTIGAVTVEMTSETAIMRWTTNEPTTGLIEHELDPVTLPYEYSTTITTPKTSHDVTVVGLEDNDDYSVRVTATDRAGNTTLGTAQIFRTYLDASSAIELSQTWSNTTIRYVSGNFRIDAGQTLTILPGTRVVLGPDTIIQVEGTLIALGTAEQPIVFTSKKLTPTPGDWDGINFPTGCGASVFDGSNFYTSGSILSHVVVEWGGKNIGAVRGSNCSLIVQDSVIRKSANAGLYWSGSGGGTAKIVVRDSVIKDNVGHGAFVGGVSAAPTVNGAFYDTTFSGNGADGIANSIADDVTVVDGLFLRNDGAMSAMAETTTNMTRAIVADNTEGVRLSTVSITGDPQATHNLTQVQFVRNGVAASEGSALRDYPTITPPPPMAPVPKPLQAINVLEGLFVGNRGTADAGVVEFDEGTDNTIAPYEGTKADISTNNFYGNTAGYSVATTVSNNLAAADIIARDAWWNATSSFSIQEQLYDYTNFTNLAVVKFRYTRPGGPEIRRSPRTRVGVGAPLNIAVTTPAAGQAALAWNDPPEPDVKGYVIHHGTTAGTYTTQVDTRTSGIGCSTTTSNGITRRTCTLTGLPAGPRYFAVTAYDGGDIEQVYLDSGYDLNPADETITARAHGLPNNRRVVLRAGGGSDPLVDPLGLGSPYFVRNPTANTFQLSLTSGGAVIDLDPADVPEGILIMEAALDAVTDVNAGTDTLTLAGHTFAPGQRVEVAAVGGGTLPGGLTAGTHYYVTTTGAGTFKLAASDGGSAIDLTTGVGYFTLVGTQPHPRARRVGAQTINTTAANYTTNVLTLNAGHGITNHQVVRVAPGTGTLPSMIAAGIDYYVVGLSGNDIKLAHVRGGAEIDVGAVLTLTPGRVDVAADTFLSPAHGLQNDNVVRVATGGTLPAPLAAATDYHVVGRTATTFKLALTSGGGAINITSSGSAAFTVTPQNPGTGNIVVTPLDREKDRRLRGNESWYSSEVTINVP